MCCVFVVVSKQVQEQHVGSIASVRAEHAPLARSASVGRVGLRGTHPDPQHLPPQSQSDTGTGLETLGYGEGGRLGENFSEKLKVPVALYYS